MKVVEVQKHARGERDMKEMESKKQTKNITRKKPERSLEIA